MSRKTLIILFGIFIIVLIIAFYPQLKSRIKPATIELANAEVNFTPFTKDSIDAFTIIAKSGEIKLSKENGKWKVNSYEASEKEVDDLFGNLKKLKVESLASRNRENHKNYGVTEEEGALLSFTKDGQTTAFIIGSSGKFGNGFYARKQDADNVYLVTGASLSSELYQTAIVWRDKMALDISKDNFQKAEIVSGNTTVVVTKNQEGKLQAESNGKSKVLDAGVTDKLFMTINPLVADDFLADSDISEFGQATGKITIRLSRSNGSPIELQLLKKADKWWGKSSEKEAYYRFDDSKFADIASPEKWFEIK